MLMCFWLVDLQQYSALVKDHIAVIQPECDQAVAKSCFSKKRCCEMLLANQPKVGKRHYLP